MVDANAKSGIIDSQEDVGGWPVLKAARPPKDSDHDGMPDKWEKEHRLNPHDPSDGSQLSADGQYTHLERYLCSLTERLDIKDRK